MEVAPRYSLRRQRTGRPVNPKLTKWDVIEIRRWVRAEGFGLPLGQQCDVMAAQFRVATKTVRDVIRNSSWFDPTYTPEVPIMMEECATYGAAWAVYLLLLWRLLCCDVSTTGSSAAMTE